MPIGLIEDRELPFNHLEIFSKEFASKERDLLPCDPKLVTQITDITSYQKVASELMVYNKSLLLLLDFKLNMAKSYIQRWRSEYAIPVEIEDDLIDGVYLACLAIENTRIDRLMIVLITTMGDEIRTQVTKWFQSRFSNSFARRVLIVPSYRGGSLVHDYNKAKKILEAACEDWHKEFGFSLWTTLTTKLPPAMTKLRQVLSADLFDNPRFKHHPEDYQSEVALTPLREIVCSADMIREQEGFLDECRDVLGPTFCAQAFSVWHGDGLLIRSNNLYNSICLAKAISKNYLSGQWLALMLGSDRDQYGHLYYDLNHTSDVDVLLALGQLQMAAKRVVLKEPVFEYIDRQRVISGDASLYLAKDGRDPHQLQSLVDDLKEGEPVDTQGQISRALRVLYRAGFDIAISEVDCLPDQSPPTEPQSLCGYIVIRLTFRLHYIGGPNTFSNYFSSQVAV